MFYAKEAIANGEQFLEAAPKLRGLCPACGGEVLAKCGSIKVWHWAHKVKDCDSWSESEGAWHKAWKSLASRECQEVTMENHRADIRTKRGLVIELQNSPISSEEIKEREAFYGKMIWVFNATSFVPRLSVPLVHWAFAHKIKHSNLMTAPMSLQLECNCASFTDLFFEETAYKSVVNASENFWSVNEGESLGEIRESELRRYESLDYHSTFRPESFAWGDRKFCVAVGRKELVPGHLWDLPYRTITVSYYRPIRQSWFSCSKPLLLDIDSPFVMLYFPQGLKAYGFNFIHIDGYLLPKSQFMQKIRDETSEALPWGAAETEPVKPSK